MRTLRSIDGVYPLFLRLSGKQVLVVGAGPVAARRIEGLLAEGAVVVVVAPHGQVPDGCTWHRREFTATDLDGAWLVQACATPAVNTQVAREAAARGVWCVDAADATSSSAWTASRIAAADGVEVAVSGGGDPVRARRLVQVLGDALLNSDLRRERPAAGSVALVGAGPGDPGLLTVRARELLAAADVVVVDRLAPRAALDMTHAQIIGVGKSPGDHTVGQDDINRILVEQALAGNRVVRLKGGDPFVLGRGGEELAACLDAGIEVEVVPGITSAVAVPAAAGIPVTHRGMATGFLVATAHGEDPELIGHLAQVPAEITIVLLMGVRSLEMVASVLLRSRSADTPAAVVERGWTPQQRTVVATLGSVAEQARTHGVQAPSIVVIGDVAALHDQFGDLARPSSGAGLIADA